MRKIGFALLMLSCSGASALAEAADARVERGETLARALCAPCHAVGKDGQSPHDGAPAFRALDERVDLDSFMERLRQGLTSAHGDMPTFRFAREDARDLIAYLRSVQGP